MNGLCTENVKSEKTNLKNKTRMLKSIKEIEKLLNSQGNGSWPSNAVAVLERNLFEIIRLLEKGVRVFPFSYVYRLYLQQDYANVYFTFVE